MMKLEREDALHCAQVFKDYFCGLNNIEEYMRDEKLKNLESLIQSLVLCLLYTVS